MCYVYCIAGEYDRKRKSTSLLQIFFLGINYSGSEDFLTSLTYSKKNTLLLKKKGFRINPFFSSLLPA